MSVRNVGELLAELAHQGERIAEGQSFTLESDRARTMLQRFALDSPDRYVLLAVASLVATKATSVQLELDSDEFTLRAACDWSREPFHGFWSRLVGRKGGARDTDLWLLGLSILTSFGLKSIDWIVESTDASGRWRYALQVRGGEVVRETVEGLLEEEAGSGLLVRAVRRGRWQVGRRYLRRLTGRLLGRQCPQEALLRHRLSPPGTSLLTMNEQPFPGLPPGPIPGLLAIARRGGAPRLRAPVVVEQSSVPQMMAAFTDPGTEGDQLMEEIVGPEGSIAWIWNGLRIGSTPHGLRYRFARVAVWSDQLQPDLSFRSAVETHQRKQFERTAKAAIRELLAAVAERLTREVNPDVPLPPEYGPMRSILICALRQRIQLSRARNRLGAVNRSLIEAPLFWGDGNGFRGRLFSFTELWERAEKGEVIALHDWGAIVWEAHWGSGTLPLYVRSEEADLLCHLFPTHLVEDRRRSQR